MAYNIYYHFDKMRAAKHGDIFRFPLDDQTYSYGQIIKSFVRIFEIRDDGKTKIDDILKAKTAFAGCLALRALRLEKIERIGKVESAIAEQYRLPLFYMYTYPDHYEINNPYEIQPRRAQRNECIGLWLFGILDLLHLQRLAIDFFEKKTTVFSLRYGKLRPDFDIRKWYEDFRNQGIQWDNPSRYCNTGLIDGFPIRTAGR